MLGECHAHVIMDGKNYKEAVSLHKDGVKEQVIHDCFQKYREAGITFLRDGGDRYGVSQRAKDLALMYGIDYRTPIFAIHKKGHYGGIVGKAFDTLEEYRWLVKEVKESGGDFIKIMVSGLIDFSRYGTLTEDGLEPSLIEEMVCMAHEEGMAVMAHCNGAGTMEAAAKVGVDSIEHGAYGNLRALKVMAEHQVIWTPTVSPIGNLKGSGRFEDSVTERITHEHLELIHSYVKLGGRIALGSDAGAWRVPHVQGLWTELDFLKKVVEESHLDESERIIRDRFKVRG